jgi:hypothetical protein
MAAQGANITPDKLPAHTRDRLFAACDQVCCATSFSRKAQTRLLGTMAYPAFQALLEMVAALQPRVVIGVGKFAEDRARKALANSFPGVQACTAH